MPEQTISELSGTLSTIPGRENTGQLRDRDNTARFIFIEKWETIAAHKNSSEYLPTNFFARIMGALEGKPNKMHLDVREKTQQFRRYFNQQKQPKTQVRQ